jgi:hypothetical protein
MKSVVNDKNSRYVAGGVTEKGGIGIEWWEREEFSLAEDDLLVEVDHSIEYRLDLIAHIYLGNSKLWWLIAQYNAILDPYGEVTVGKIVRIPSLTRLQNLLSGSLGGVKSQREYFKNQIRPIL